MTLASLLSSSGSCYEASITRHRGPRLAGGDLAYHDLNRRVGRLSLFEKPADYAAFEKILAEAVDRTHLRIAAYCLMSNHRHLLLWPRRDGEISEVLRWITVTHTQRWHAHHKTARGRGRPSSSTFDAFSPIWFSALFWGTHNQAGILTS